MYGDSVTMARTTRPLSDTEIKKARPKDKEYNLADGGGLQLRMRPSGAKLWLFNYSRPYTKKRANLSLGSYPDVTLADAKKEAAQARELLTKDIDPQEHRSETIMSEKAELENTFEFVAAKWMEVKRTQVTRDYGDDIWRSLENHLFKELGKRPIRKLKAPMVIEVLNPIAAKGNLETIKRLCQRVNEIMIYATNVGFIDANPLAGIKEAFSSPKKKHMLTLKPEELPELMKAIHSASIKKVTRYLIEWQLHTMVRPSEAAGARWEEIDWKEKLWNIPGERMKKKKPHSVPLSSQMLIILEDIKPISGSLEYIFPADRDRRKHTNAQTANSALKRMGFEKRLVSHGLRALASTTLNENDFNYDAVEAALAHSDSNEVRAAYNRATYLQQRREMMQWWSDHIDEATKNGLFNS